MKKKVLAATLAATMMVGSMVSGTVSVNAAEPYKIAVGLADSGATMFSIMSNNIKEYAALTGGEAVFQGGVAASADTAIGFVENQIAAGVDGIILAPPADSVLPTITALCEEAGVYWGTYFRDILDEDIKAMVESSQYYVGRCYEDEVQTGYQVMANLNDLGAKKVAIISMAKGNTTTDNREIGANQAAEEFGMEIVAEARDTTQASDATTAAESFLMAYNDLDAIYVVGTTGQGIHEAVAKAIEDAGRADSVKLATIDFPDSMGELFEKDILVTCVGLPHWGFDPFMSFVSLANTCMGTPISDEKVHYTCEMFEINDLDTANKWLEKFGNADTLYYSDEEMTSLLVKENNADLTEETMQGFIDAFAEVAVN